MKPIPTMRAAGFLTSSYRSGWLRRRSAAWLGATLILFSALFPLVAQAGNRFLGLVTWVELCSGYSMEVIAIDREGNPVKPDVESAARCIVCLTCASSLALPASGPCMPRPVTCGTPAAIAAYDEPDLVRSFVMVVFARAPPDRTV